MLKSEEMTQLRYWLYKNGDLTLISRTCVTQPGFVCTLASPVLQKHRQADPWAKVSRTMH